MIELSKTVLGHPITVTAVPLGDGWNICITGGCTPHVGSVSLAEYCDAKVTLHTSVCQGHKDQIVSDLFAEAIANQCKCTVCVACGIHYDKPTKDELEQIVLCTRELLSQLCSLLQKQ